MALTDQQLLDRLQNDHVLTIEAPITGYIVGSVKIDPETLQPVDGGKLVINTEKTITARSREYYFAQAYASRNRFTRKYFPVHGCVRKCLYDAIEDGILTEQIPEDIAGMEAEANLSAPVPRIMFQLFRITSVVENENYVTVTARHVWYDNLKNYTLWQPPSTADEYSAADVCRAVLENAASPTVSHVECNCTDTKQGKEFDYKRKNLVETFLDPTSGICAKFNLSLIRYNWDFWCLTNVGYDRGFVIEDGKNLLGVERKESIENVATRVIPYGQDEEGYIVWLNNNGKKYVDSPNIDDYSCPQVEMFDTGLRIGENGVTSTNINGKLLAAGQARFSVDHVDDPEVEMKVTFISLGDTEEYSQYRDLDKVFLHDTLTIKDSIRGYSYTARVVGITHDILTGMLLSATIGTLDNWSGTRKVATWQIPEISGNVIRLSSIRAGSFQAGAINGDDVAESSIRYSHFKQATKNSINTYALQAAAANIHELIAGSITAEDIVAGSITTVTLAAEAITADKIAANAVTADKIQAGAIGAEKIVAGAITTEKLDAYAVTAAKIAANAVTADKIQTGAIKANHIDTDDITAINATLGTANIADARIALADISYAKVKDLNAQSAYFGQAVIQEGLANKLYIPRLAANYAQIVNATISDLVIQATNDNYYKLDVDLSGNVTATQITPSAQEISDGHTSDGRTIYMGTDIVATDLNTMNIYASHALMDEITANILNVDSLFAREATIGKLNALDLSSNTYIQATIGNWQSGSTITQTINSLDSRISSLGYGTVYMQPNEPSHSELVSGDIWIQTMSDGSWQDIYDNFSSWNDVYNNVSSWQVLGSIPIMWVWDGQRFQLMYDALLPTTIETEIEQLATAITLRATKAEVDILSGEVSEFAAQLTIQADEIEAAVSAVNAKAASYVMWADPRTAHSVSLGDIWVKRDTEGFNDTSTWQTVYDEFESWQALYDMHDSWGDVLGDRTYIWNGSAWIETSDRAAEVYQKTLIDQNSTSISLIAQTTATLQGDLIALSASLTVANDHISAEVTRATNAENGKIDKTSQYQTADSIVNSVKSWVGTSLASESYISQTATGIVAYVADHAYAIQSGISIDSSGIEISGAKYIKIKSGGYFAVDSGNFSIDTSGNVIVNGAVTATTLSASTAGYIAGWTISANRLSSGSGSGYVALDSTAGGTYAIWAGNSNPASAKFWVKRSGEAYFEGQIKAAAGSVLGGWTLDANSLHSGSGGNYVALASSGTYAIWAGAENAGSAPFWVARNGEAHFEGEIEADAGSTLGGWTLGSDTLYSGSGSSYVALCSDGSTAMWAGSSSPSSAPFRVDSDGTVYMNTVVTETEQGGSTTIDLESTPLWKLGYATVKSLTVSGGYCTSITFSNDVSGSRTVNFNHAVPINLTGAWNGMTFTVTETGSGETLSETVQYSSNAGYGQYDTITVSTFNSAHFASARVMGSAGSVVCGFKIDAGDVYDDGWIDGYNAAVSKLSLGVFGVIVVPAETDTAGDEKTEEWIVSADVQNTAQGWYTGYAYVAGVQKATKSRQFS